MDAILQRRSVRKFDTDKKISNEDLVKLCKYGQSAPTARNQSSREYIIINDKAQLDKLCKVSAGAMVLSGCNTAIAVVGKDPSTISTPSMQIADLAAATENILIAATSFGFASCWIGICPEPDRMAKSKEILNILDDRFIYSFIALGYPLSNDVFEQKDKLCLEDIHFNRG